MWEERTEVTEDTWGQDEGGVVPMEKPPHAEAHWVVFTAPLFSSLKVIIALSLLLISYWDCVLLGCATV